MPTGKPRRKSSTAGFFGRSRDRVRKLIRRHPREARYAAIATAVILVIGCALTGYYYVRFSRMIDARLHGDPP